MSENDPSQRIQDPQKAEEMAYASRTDESMAVQNDRNAKMFGQMAVDETISPEKRAGYVGDVKTFEGAARQFRADADKKAKRAAQGYDLDSRRKA